MLIIFIGRVTEVNDIKMSAGCKKEHHPTLARSSDSPMQLGCVHLPSTLCPALLNTLTLFQRIVLHCLMKPIVMYVCYSVVSPVCTQGHHRLAICAMTEPHTLSGASIIIIHIKLEGVVGARPI